MAWEHKTEEEIHNAILKTLEENMKEFRNRNFLLTSLTYEEEMNRVKSNGMVVDYLPTGRVFISIEAERNESS